MWVYFWNLPVISGIQIIQYSLNEKILHHKIFYDELGCSFNPNEGNQFNWQRRND